jgi:hypothetical protein
MTVRVGPIRLWFSAGLLVAFELRDDRLVVRDVSGLKKGRRVAQRHLAEIEAARFAERLEPEEFELAWHTATDKYLFPKRVGKIRQSFPLDRNTPLLILADWLQDHGCDEAATVLKDAEAD